MEELADILKRLAPVAVDPERAKEWDRIERRRAVHAMALPPSLERWAIDHTDVDGTPRVKLPQHDRIRAALDAYKLHIVLTGIPGTGKTTAAIEALAAGRPLRWRNGAGETCTTIEVAGAYVEASVYCRCKPWGSRRSAYDNASMLVLDDLGLEREGDSKKIEELLYLRHVNERVTIVTTNLDGAEFARRYSDRIASRLRERGRWIKCEQVVRPGNTDARPQQGQLDV